MAIPTDTTVSPHAPVQEARAAASARRQARYVEAEHLRSISCRAGARTCMHGLGVNVSLASSSAGVVHVGGVQRCGSPWACPVCAPTIGQRRALELDQAMGGWIGAGGSVLFVTATLQHDHGDHLDQLLEMLQRAWTKTWNWGGGRRPAWYFGQVRAIEITHGGNGWHPHVHAAVFVNPGHDPEHVRSIVTGMAARWGESVEREGGRTRVTPIRDPKTGELVVPGWHVRHVDEAAAAADYLTKVEGGWGAGLELARLDLKRGKGLTPQQLLSAAVAGDRHAEILYLVFERATMGRRRIVASPGLMKRCGVEELTDDQAAEADGPDDVAALVMVPAEDWRRLLAARFVGQLLDDVAAIGRGDSDGWPWPPDWLVQRPPPSQH